MNPDVVSAIDKLVREGVLEPRASVPLRRAALGSLVSVGEELRILLAAGVIVVMTGVGVLVKQNLDRIGPVAIAVVLGVAAALFLGWAWRRAPAPSFAFDSVLLLGALLAAADLAFIEVKFTPLGEHWTWHLLLVAVAYAGLAFRFDSKSLFSLSLTSFAAWRGVSVSGVATPWRSVVGEDRLLIEALICGVIFLALGKLLESSRLKPHFEPVASWLGSLLIVGALAFRLETNDGRVLVAAALAGSGLVLAWFAWDERSVGRYAVGIGAIAVGAAAVAGEVIEYLDLGRNAFLIVVVLLAAAVITLILRAHRSLKASA